MPAYRPQSFREWRFLIKRTIRRRIPRQLLRWYFGLFPIFWAWILRWPSRRLTVVGVTGTDGKSSTVILTSRLLNRAGRRTGYSSSVLFSDGLHEIPNTEKMTMPGRGFLQRWLQKILRNGAEIAVVEVTSEGIAQQRHAWVDVDVAVLTNLYPEHIESHGGYSRYRSEKGKLFEVLGQDQKKSMPKTSVVNIDAHDAAWFLHFSSDQKITFSPSGQPADVRVKSIESTFMKNRLALTIHGTARELDISIGGPFFVPNITAAAATALSLGLSPDQIADGLLHQDPIPGRFQVVSQSPWIIVDYAHTVVAVEQLLTYLRTRWAGNIIHIFGAAGGGRDRWKRQELAKLSERYANISILTEENPFDEPVENIIADIQRGFSDHHHVLVVPDRREAVRKALRMADKQTLIVSTAKGSETVIAGPYGRRKPYNDGATFQWFLAQSSSVV